MSRHLSMSLRTLLSLTVIALALALAGSALADAAADRIKATPGGGHSEWDAKVKLILLANYDLDGSAWIDKVPEIQSIPCSTWGALDAGVRAGWGDTGLRKIYGFEAGFSWVGSAIGFSEALRPQADAALGGCEEKGFGDGGGAPTGAVTTGPVDVRIRSLSEVGGSSEWDAAVKPLIVGAYDTNRSGTVDTTDELLAMPCEVFVALDLGVREKWPSGLRQVYGFMADLSWVGYTLGFAESVRSGADVRIATCLQSAGTVQATPAPTPAPVPAPTSGSTHDRIRAVPGGGSGSWDSVVGEILTGAYDANASGWLDTGAEIQAVTCLDWKAMDEGVKAGWGYGLRVIYGFHPEYSWVGDALHISESLRTVADARLVECLEGGGPAGASAPPTAPTLTDPAALIASFPDGGTGAWDTQVMEVLIAFYDTNGSGLINTKAELNKIPCGVWGAMDAGVKQRFQYGLRPIYGFEDGYSWIGSVLGFHDSMRKHGDKALQTCGFAE